MDYKEKYEQALERAKDLRKDAIDMGENIRAKQCEIIFPELKESDDEKIRKYLLKLANRCQEDSIDFMRGVKKGDIIAWLEKQGKQKVSYTTIVETGNGGINTLVTGELPIDGEQNPIEFKWSADDKNKLLIIEQILNCANLLISSQELTETKNWLNSLKQRIGE